MGKIDIFIYLLILVFTLIGMSKGFVKQVMSTANWLVSLIGAFALIKPFSKIMLRTPISTSVNTKVADWISTKGETFSAAFDSTNAQQQLANAISELGLPKFIANIISKEVNFSNIGENLSLADVLAPTIGNIIVNIISFVLLFLLIFILLKLIIHLINIVFEGGVLGFFNKLLGGALGFLKAAIIISVIMLVLSVLSGVVPSVNEFLVKDLKLDSDAFSIGKFFYQNNPLIKLIEGSFSFQDILG